MSVIADCVWVHAPIRDGLLLEATRNPRDAVDTRHKEKTMPVITVQQGPRSVELKRELVRKLTDAMVEAYRIPAEAVQVWINETPTDSWGQAGRLTADK